MPVADLEERLQSLLATLEECQATLAGEGSSETAKLLSLAILELRMERYGVTDSELKAVCDAMVPGDAPGASNAGKLLRPYLRVVK